MKEDTPMEEVRQKRKDHGGDTTPPPVVTQITQPATIAQLLHYDHMVHPDDIPVNGTDETIILETGPAAEALTLLAALRRIQDVTQTYTKISTATLQAFSAEHPEVKLIIIPGTAVIELQPTGDRKAFQARRMDDDIAAGDEGRYTLQEVRERYTLPTASQTHGRRVTVYTADEITLEEVRPWLP